MRRILMVLLFAMVIAPSSSCAAFPREIREPIQEVAWSVRPARMVECGHYSDFIYKVFWTPGSDKYVLAIKRWKDGLLGDVLAFDLPQGGDVIPVSQGKCGLSYQKSGNAYNGVWPYALVRLEDNKILKEWEPDPTWWWRLAGASRNGKFISLLAQADIRDNVLVEKDLKAGIFIDRVRVALIDIDSQELKWVGELNEHGVGTIETIVVTNEGRYVAVIGWANGTAMIDAKEGKVIWSKRPEGEISSGYGAFSPDGKKIFTTGSSGCVFEIDVATGDVLKERWATPTGTLINGLRSEALAVSPDGQWLAAGLTPTGDVYVWNLKEGGRPLILKHGYGAMQLVAFSPESKSIATMVNGQVKVWSLEKLAPHPTSAPASSPASQPASRP